MVLFKYKYVFEQNWVNLSPLRKSGLHACVHISIVDHEPKKSLHLNIGKTVWNLGVAISFFSSRSFGNSTADNNQRVLRGIEKKPVEMT